MSSPGPKPLAPKPRGLGLTLKSHGPLHHHPITFKHEGGVPHQYSKSKNILEWYPVLVNQKKIQLDSKRKDMGKSTMFKENIIKLTNCTIIKMPASRVDKFSAVWTNCRSSMLTRT